MSYYDQLVKFLNQAQSDGLTVNEYRNTYNGLRVRVSFGQGNPARVPWIAFLDSDRVNQVSNGIYPVYLYYKSLGILILAYGVSETNRPTQMWPIHNDVPTIESWFRRNNFGIPTRYGQSFVYNYYTVDHLPSAEIMDNDLNELLAYYNGIAIERVLEPANQPENEELSVDRVSTSNGDGFNIGSFKSSLQNSRLRFSDQLIYRFVASLLTKPFVILTGLSGSGKTKLAQAFVQWICENTAQYRIVPVGADWTSREPVLGYPNALE